ncbi:hypothetical protein J1614_004773 [Plenodomus biglobosus]|nr:hypothetical protein J1614_004773 [Plenodomus biglobosus]
MRQDWAAARAAHSTMPDTGKDEPVTRYLMYKVGLQSNDLDFGKSLVQFGSICTARLLQSEVVKDGKIDPGLMSQLCMVFDGGKDNNTNTVSRAERSPACSQAKASRRRPSTPAQQLFTAEEFEWFSKNTYNLSLKYCTEMAPKDLVRLLSTCTEVSSGSLTAGTN